MEFRHEWKHELNDADVLILRSRLRGVMRPDAHAENGTYRVRSLYFDTPTDRALFEKIDGVNDREKFRIRLYNDDASFIRLEKKRKLNGLCQKTSAAISAEQVRALLDGDTSFLKEAQEPLLRELYVKMRVQALQPKTLVEYTREPFVFAAGNVRVTIDSDLKTGVTATDLLCADAPLVRTESPPLLEVKWDEFLPDVVRDAVALENRRVGAFSKYAACRIYG